MIITEGGRDSVVLRGSQLLRLTRGRKLEVCQLSGTGSRNLVGHFSSTLTVCLGRNGGVRRTLTVTRSFVGVRLIERDGLRNEDSRLCGRFVSRIGGFYHACDSIRFCTSRLGIDNHCLTRIAHHVSNGAPGTVVSRCVIGRVRHRLSAAARAIRRVTGAFNFSSRTRLAGFFGGVEKIAPSTFERGN